MSLGTFSIVLALFVIHASRHALAVSNCGVTSFNFGSRIYHGTPVPLGKWPWMAAIVKRGDYVQPHTCTASVISNEHILTAAHCVNITDFDQQLQVVVGAVDIVSRETKRYDIAEHVQHPEYVTQRSHGTLARCDNDIAIIKLATPLSFSEYIKPICLTSRFAEHTDTQAEHAIIAGWGFRDVPDVRTPVLLEGTAYFQNFETCQQEHMGFPMHKRMHLCTNGRKNHVMKGDSGGPIFVQIQDKQGQIRWHAVGVNSFGNGISPGAEVSTRVSSYCDFIETATEGKATCEQ
ncbi:trypsin domain-containing protein [Ditylenchus destructor]|uniref:Trypsin domain-containing protein n=1 Tax=Ditylenchus destructor TaxID=166010 RepID=A0AAD4MLW8_9BILA|nr:trypsin domain-containing protein [Ditylenchus destructor]